MPIELKIPAVGESITEVQINEWLKAEGDSVKQDEPVAVIDSEKTTFELTATQAGTLGKILHQAGDTVSVGAVVAHIEAGGDAKTQATAPAKVEAKAASEPAPKMTAPVEKAKEAAPAPKKEATPAPVETKEEPKEEAAPAPVAKAKPPEAKPAPAAPKPRPVSDKEEEVVPMTMLRRAVARHLVDAQQTMAMLTTFNEVDMSAVMSFRKEQQENFEKAHQVKLGFMSFFVKATIDALKKFPQLNAEVRGDSIVYRNRHDMGVAIATERGLVVPVICDAGHMSFAEVEKAIADFAKRGREGKLKPDELQGGTFTITNGGAFGSLFSTPIINPPQAGILGMHSIADRPVAVQGQVVIRPIMYVALTYDHRIVDGREAVLFLKRIKELIENPARMLIEA